MQFFPRFTTVSPGLAALPLLFVLFVTALKDGYEDLKRHQSDRAINNIKVSSQFRSCLSRADSLCPPRQVLTLRGTYHNHNRTKAKSRSLGLPTFMRNWFVGRSLVAEAEHAENERQTERKKAFWGRRRVRRPKKKGETASNGEGLAPSEVPRDAPGGGTLQAGKKAGKGDEARIPEMHERLEGDHFADSDKSSESSALATAAAHVPLTGSHYDHAVWTRESWEDLQVGDFVRLRGDESVPAGECELKTRRHVC